MTPSSTALLPYPDRCYAGIHCWNQIDPTLWLCRDCPAEMHREHRVTVRIKAWRKPNEDGIDRLLYQTRIGGVPVGPVKTVIVSDWFTTAPVSDLA